MAHYRCIRSIASLLMVVVAIMAPTTQTVSASQTTRDSRALIDSYITDQMNELQIPGVAIGVVRGEEIVYVQGYGRADDSGRSMTADTPFLIASLSKSFTALGIMQLAEEGRLELDAPVQKYLPWFQVAEEDASAQITIRHLLNQTSGFPEREGYVRNLDRNPADSALETSVRGLKTQSLNAPPGRDFEYSNTNYDILGLVIQAASGQSYDTYVQDRIFTPLNMKDSYTSLADARGAGMTRGYYPLFGFPVAYDHVMPYSRAVLPSAGLFSSAEDLTHYLIAHLNQGRYEGKSILSPGGMDELHAPAAKIGDAVSYAMGWVVFPFNDAVTEAGEGVPTAVSHGGQWAGFEANIVLIPRQDLGVVVLVNKSDPASGSAFSNLGWNISLLALGLEPVDYPTADFMTRNGRGLLAGSIWLLGVALMWSARKIRRLSTQEATDNIQSRQRIIQMIVLTLVDLILAGWLLFIKLPDDNDTLALALRFNPDIGLMYILFLVLTLGGSFLRTLLLIVYIPKKDRPRVLA